MKKNTHQFLLLATTLMLTAFARSFADDPIYVYDSDNSGSEFVTLIGSTSFDPDGVIIDYQWKVNAVVISTGYGPTVQDFTYNYSLGWSTVTLVVRDDVQVSSAAVIRVVVLPQGTNVPPVADATVPSHVQASTANVALVSVNASLSSDPDGDPIIRYVWSEGTNTLSDGNSPITTFNLNGLGSHTVRLKVFSRDNLNIIQTGIKDFTITVDGLTLRLAGRDFSLDLNIDFPFSGTTYGSYAALTYNALTQTYFVTENDLDKIFEFQGTDGALLRTIDIAALKRSGIATADVEGLAWMGGTKYAAALHDGKEIAILTILSTTTAITRPEATIYNVASWPGKPKGLAYLASEDALYGVTKDTPKAVVKSKINKLTGQLDTIWTKEVDNLPASNLSDITFFPRLSSFPLLVSESTKTVMEVDLTGATAVLRSSCSLVGLNIPQGSGLVFGSNDAKLRIVTKHESGVGEDEYNVFAPTEPIPNLRPHAIINGQLGWVDLDGDGYEEVLVQGHDSSDLDGMIIRYEWFVDGVKVNEGTGNGVTDLNHRFAVGTSSVTLVVYDDNDIIDQQMARVRIDPQGSNLPPLADATVPPSVEAGSDGVATVFVDASLSSDPDGDLINRYKWSEGNVTYYDQADATASLTLNGFGEHALTLLVYSTDQNGITQTGEKIFF